MPPGGFHHFDGAERRFDDADARRVAHPAGEAQRDGGDHVGPGDEERQRQPAPRGEHHVRPDAAAQQCGGGGVGLRVGQPDGRMRQGGQVFEGEAAVAQPWVGGIGDEHDPVPHDHLGLVLCGQPRRRDQQVIAEQAPVSLGHVLRGEPHLNACFRGAVVHPAQQRFAKHGHRVIREANGEHAVANWRLVGLPGGKRAADVPRRFLHRGEQRPRQRSELVAVARPYEQFVPVMPAQPGQGVAYRRLGHAEAHACARDVSLFKQRLQDDEEVQVDAAERHSVTPVNLKSNQLWN